MSALLSKFEAALQPVLEVETNPEALTRTQCPICQYNDMANAYVYCSWDEDHRLTHAVAACSECTQKAFKEEGIRTMSLTRFQQAVSRVPGSTIQRTAANPQRQDTWLLKMALSAVSVFDLRPFSNDQCMVCGEFHRRGDRPLRVFYRNDDNGRFEHYAVSCHSCAEQAHRDEGIETMELDKYLRTLLGVMPGLLRLAS